MLRRIGAFGTLALGTTLAGAVVGVAEGVYRDVSPLYAGALYACLWALVGAGLCVALALVGVRPPRRRRGVGPAALGAMLAVGISAAILVRFIVLRDVLQEAVDANIPATAAGLGAAVLAVALAYAVGALLTPRRDAEHPRAWLAPAAAVALLGLLALRGDDTFPEPGLPRPLAGSGVILVVCDTLRADALGIYGAGPHRGAPPTPEIDAFAREARVFTDVSAQATWTKAAVSSILTSRHVSGHATMAKPAVLPASLPTVASALQPSGVHTGAVVTNYNLDQSFGFDHGFDRFEYLPPARYLGAPARANKLVAYNVIRLVRETLLTSGREARFFYRDGATVNRVAMGLLDKMAAGADDRFFLWLHYMEPHDPYFSVDGKSYARVSDPHPPESWAEPMRLAYRDEVRRFDIAFGQLLAELRARGLRDRTTVVLVADHGEEFFEHGGWYHGTTLYEEQLAVPLVISGHGVPVGVETGLARQIDVAPTVAALLGVAPPASWEGRNLLGDAPPPAATLAEEDHEGNVLTSLRLASPQHRLKLIRANPGNPRGLQPTELYDLAQDPREQAPRTDEAALRELTGALDAAKNCAAVGAATAQAKELTGSDQAELRALGYVR